jgi:hypothetical protein
MDPHTLLDFPPLLDDNEIRQRFQKVDDYIENMEIKLRKLETSFQKM